MKITFPKLQLTLIPKSPRRLDINLVSAKSGILDKVKPLFIIRDKAIKGSAAFLAPLILTFPLSWVPPVIKIFSFDLFKEVFIILFYFFSFSSLTSSLKTPIFVNLFPIIS